MNIGLQLALNYFRTGGKNQFLFCNFMDYDIC